MAGGTDSLFNYERDTPRSSAEGDTNPPAIQGGQVTPSPDVVRLTYRLTDLAKAFGISRRTLERERSAGRFPRPDLKIGKAPLWKPETIRAWIDNGGGQK